MMNELCVAQLVAFNLFQYDFIDYKNRQMEENRISPVKILNNVWEDEMKTIVPNNNKKNNNFTHNGRQQETSE